MAYTPAGRQQDNSILSQIMKYDKSVQPAQSYTNVSPQYTPFGRMEDWETLAKGLGRGIGATAKNIKEGAYKGTYDPREEGYKWAPGKLAAAGIGAGVAGIGGLIGKVKDWAAKRKEEKAWQQKAEEEQYTPEEWDAMETEGFESEDEKDDAADYMRSEYGISPKILTDEQKRARGPRRTEARVALQQMEG